MIDREELEPDLDHRLGLARLGLAPPTEVRRRVWDSLARRPGSELLARPPAPRQTGLAAPRQTGVGRARGVSTLVTMALMGLSFAAGYWLRAQPAPSAFEVQSPASSAELGHAANPAGAGAEPAPVDDANVAARSRESVAVSPAPASPAPASPTVMPPDGDGARVERTRSTVIRPRQPAKPSATDSGELALLQRTERALRSGDPSLAISFLDELDERFPNTLLNEERTAARVLAECARSEVLARARALRFLGDRADSVYSDRIRHACDLETATTAGSSEEPARRGH